VGTNLWKTVDAQEFAMSDKLTVYGAQGSGSITVEAALTLMGIPFDLVEASTWDGPAQQAKVAGVNPLKQVPALVLPGGEVLTESAAILIWLGDSRPDAGLSPRLNDPRRAEYLRWMVYIPAAIYSMFWVRDDPSRLAADAAAETVIKERTADRIAECWRLMDSQTSPSPYILGDTFSLLDIYVTVVSRWTPGRRRFYAEAPRLADVVRRVDAEPRLAAFWPERFPFLPGWER
jgi:GST-like protein